MNFDKVKNQEKVVLGNKVTSAILVNPFKDYKEGNDVFGNIFDGTHASNSSSSNSIENTNLVCDLERKEVIFGSLLCFHFDEKVKDEQIQTFGNNVDVFYIGKLHHGDGYVNTSHYQLIFRTYSTKWGTSPQGDGYVKPSFSSLRFITNYVGWDTSPQGDGYVKLSYH